MTAITITDSDDDCIIMRDSNDDRSSDDDFIMMRDSDDDCSHYY
jgi:hypothetical protein